MDHHDDTSFVLGRKRKEPEPSSSSSSSSSSSRNNSGSFKLQKTTQHSDVSNGSPRSRLPLPAIVTGKPLVIDNRQRTSTTSIPDFPNAIPNITPLPANFHKTIQQQKQQQKEQVDKDKSRTRFPKLSIPRNNKRGKPLCDFLDEIKRRWRIRYDRIPKDRAEWKELDAFRKHQRNQRLKHRYMAQQKFAKTYATIQRPKQGFDVEYKSYIMQFIAEKLETAEPGNIPIFQLPKEFEKKLQYETAEIQIPGLTKRLARTFYPYSKNGFTHNSYRNRLGQTLKKVAEENNAKGKTNNPCIKAGPKHGSVIARLMHLVSQFLRSDPDTKADAWMQHKELDEIDHCVLRILKNLDERGAVLLETEKDIFDEGLWYHTPIDAILHQEPGYFDTDGNEIPEGPQFGEIKSGYEIGDFTGVELGDVKYQHLPALFDTPYMRAVLQLLTSMITTKMRYDYCPRSGIIIHVSPRRGEVSVYGMPKWLADKACVLYVYFCLSQYTPSRHMERIAYGLKIDSPYIPKVMNSEGDLTIIQQIDQGMKSAAISAVKSSKKSSLSIDDQQQQQSSNSNYDDLMSNLIDTEELNVDDDSIMSVHDSSSSSSSSSHTSRTIADDMPAAYTGGFGGGVGEGSGGSLWEYVLKKKSQEDEFSSDEELEGDDGDYDHGMVYFEDEDQEISTSMDPFLSHLRQPSQSNYISVGSG